MISKRDLRPFIGANETERKVREAAKIRINAAVKAARDKRHEIRERIWNGESTGDRFRDFALASHGKYSDAEVERYREIDTELAKNAGQLALLSWYEDENTRALMTDSALSTRGDLLYARRHFVYVGIHMGEGLRLIIGDDESSAACYIPVKPGYVRAWSGLAKPDFLNPSVHGPGSRKLRSYLAEEQPFQLLENYYCMTDLYHACYVVLGDARVTAWLEENESVDFLAFVRSKLKKPASLAA